MSTVFALAGAVLMLLVIAPDLQARHQWLAMLASFAPYGWVCWLVAVIVAVAATRQRLLILPLVAGLAAHTLVLLPYLPGTPAAVAGQRSTLAILELNLRFGLADIGQLSAEVDRSRPDVVVLAEVTESNLRILKNKAWRERLPYRLGTAAPDYDPATYIGEADGTMILSRFPLTELGRTKATAFTNLAARVALPDHPFVLVAAHPANPSHSLGRWLQDAQAVAELTAGHTAEPLVVAGDLNATAEHLTLRELKARAGLTDTATGHGWHPTYPADAWYPPLIQIDHVLVSAAFTTTALDTFAVAGTDHRGLNVRLAFS
ncbi:MAG: endonuclease/exonuclease/phosphatase family protein [Propionicimonas sp.]